MVQVRHEPVKEIVILDRVKYSLDDFTKVLGMSPTPVVASWSGSIVFAHRMLPWNDQTIKEAIEGRIYWSHISYAELPVFKNVIESKDGKVRIGVIDVSSSEVLKQAAKWIKMLERLPEYYSGGRGRMKAKVAAKV